MPLPLEEVKLGAVAYFDHTVLLSDPDIDRDDDGLNRPGPFVCVQIDGDKSVWCAVTSEHRPERLLLQPQWRENGSRQWRTTPQYLVDGLNTYLGPIASFIRAAAAETPFVAYPRPSLNQDGVAAVLAEIEKQGGPLL